MRFRLSILTAAILLISARAFAQWSPDLYGNLFTQMNVGVGNAAPAQRLAMRSEPVDLAGIKIHRPGTLIGKALEPLASGEGEILVLLSLQ